MDYEESLGLLGMMLLATLIFCCIELSADIIKNGLQNGPSKEAKRR
jgi:hypothetical protein